MGIRMLRHGEEPPASEPRRYQSRGYVRLRWKVGPRQYVECYEHRLVAGLPPDGFEVHHLNGVKDDNRPENLAVLTPDEHREHHASERRLDDDEVRRLYVEQGLTTVQIARRIGCNNSAVFRSLRRSGVDTSTRTRVPRVNVDEYAVAELYRAGVRVARIAKLLGVGRLPVERVLRSLGLSPCSPTGRPTDAELRGHRAAAERLGLEWGS